MDDLRLLDEDCDKLTEETVLEAVKSGDLKQLCELVNSGADVNVRDALNKTALMCAVETGSFKCLYVLIKAGAYLNAVDDENNTALIYAVDCNAIRCMELLVNAGADVNKLNIHGRTALSRAAELLQKSCLEVLIKAGADVNKKQDNGETILSFMLGQKSGLFESYERISARPECLEVLLEAGADVNIPSRDGETPLIQAISRLRLSGLADMVESLLRYGADVNTVNKYNSTPLIIVASLVDRKGGYSWYDGQRVHQAQLLLKSGARLKRTVSGFNALEHHIAFSNKVNKKLSMLLLAAGETTRQKIPYGKDGKVVNIIAPNYLTKPETKELCLKSLCRRMMRKHLLQMSPVNLFCTVPLLGLSTELSNYLLYNVSLDADVEKWDARKDDDDGSDDDDDDDNSEINLLRMCTHRMHANGRVLSAAVNKLKSILPPATAVANDDDLSSSISSSSGTDTSRDSLLPTSSVVSSNSNTCHSRSSSSSISSSVSSSDSDHDYGNNVVANTYVNKAGVSNADRSKRKRDETSPVADRHVKRRFVGRFPVNGDDYSALDIDFESSDDGEGVSREKSRAACDDGENNNTVDFKDDVGSDANGKFSSDDEEVEGKFSDDDNNNHHDVDASGGGNPKLHNGKESKEKSLGQIRKDITDKLEQLKHWVSKAVDPAQLQSVHNELSFCTNCILFPKS